MTNRFSDATTRFSSRVDNYVKYRPGYPEALIPFLSVQCGLTPSSVVADIGSGTGKLTELFLKNGNPVAGVEPNREMREAGEVFLKSFVSFRSVNGTAEATTLENNSVDMVVAGQAFHWFNREAARREFVRILKRDGWIVLIWNDRKTEVSPFLRAYDDLLKKFATDYTAVNHKNVDAVAIGTFFGPTGFQKKVFPNTQKFDLPGLQGRLLSSSYSPEAGHPKHIPMLEALTTLFNEHQSNGTVSLECETAIYYGRLPA